ncbi:tyrosine-type recombinase/integrase [Chthonobacter rhizosphaerae]|uniref:tyrosine-type recombinase/integrase n=1 Tax=Chthonobacter rhizosphaerae TaxID=2735553 RepID=UPI0015EEF907|nr:site-specific integrase [Chthonobacter rhizosphaerae]
MGRQLHKLTAREVKAITEEGRYGDGGGLYLSVSSGDRRRWVFLFRWDGKTREMGLGSAQDVTLAEARRAAGEARTKVKAGIDPIADRRHVVEAPRVPTFGDFADELVAELEHGFRNPKHRAQWRMTLTTYAAPLRSMRVDEIKTEDVLAVLKPIWRTKPETASRLRGRIERVLDAAKARGFRSGENPAAWRGHLKNLLPARQKLTRGHHKAMPFEEVPAFVAHLRSRSGVSDRALEFCILTAARSGEVLGATWKEFDLSARVWTVPAARMKAGREHRVPLTEQAMSILSAMATFGQEPDGYVFPGAKPGRPLSVMAMDMVLRRMKLDVTVHGFRSSFRDWAGEATPFPREVAEAALAHTVGDQTERAYRRGDALDKRRELMTAWAGYAVK